MRAKNPTVVERLSQQWGERLRRERLRQNKTQVTYGREVGVDQTTVSKYERGNGAWTPEMMVSFACALDMSVPELFPWPVGIEDAHKFSPKKRKVAA